MIMITYPDGTRELRDGGLTIRVQDDRLVSATLTYGSDADPIALDVEAGEPQSFGYLAQKRVQRKWVAQLHGQVPFDLPEGPILWEDTPIIRANPIKAVGRR